MEQPPEGRIIHLSLGSNLGDRLKNLQAAIEMIGEQLGRPVAQSGIYESPPWGYHSENHFYNCSLSVATELEPLPLLDGILRIERAMGRMRGTAGYSDRIIDVDLLFYGDTILDHPRLKIPHPAMERRRFVLAPLAEIAFDVVHPVNGLTVGEMLEQCGDQPLLKIIPSQSR